MLVSTNVAVMTSSENQELYYSLTLCKEPFSANIKHFPMDYYERFMALFLCVWDQNFLVTSRKRTNKPNNGKVHANFHPHPHPPEGQLF